PDSGLSIKPISVTASARIVNFAFNYARSHGRRKVTAVHKANIMKFTDGLFLQVAQEIAKEHPDIQFNDRIVDNMSMQLVQNPKEYDMKAERNDPSAVGTSQVTHAIVARLEKARTPTTI